MKVFSWKHSKLNAKQATRKRISISTDYSSREEFSDWPDGLLAIGTFGNKNGTFGNKNATEELERSNDHGREASRRDDLQDIAPEDVEEIQKELKLILDKQEVECCSLVEGDSCLESSSDGNDTLCRDSTKNSTGKKSVSFLMKLFLRRTRFILTPSLRDPITEIRHKKSRMEKILRTILNKKIYPQSSSPKATTPKKYLQNENFCKSDSEDEMFEEANEGSKWVKSDAEFIVLEI